MFEQISASAGSGKTYTLTRRFLELLRSTRENPAIEPCGSLKPQGGGAPAAFSEILAMTFTNKAASEMKARVLRELKLLALDRGKPKDGQDAAIFTPDEAGAWVDLLLRRYDALNIRTIDSFLTLLTRLSAVSLDIPPDFEPAFAEEEFFSPLYDALLDQAASGDQAVCGLLRLAARYLVRYEDFKGLGVRGAMRSKVLEVLGLLSDVGGGRDSPARTWKYWKNAFRPHV